MLQQLGCRRPDQSKRKLSTSQSIPEPGPHAHSSVALPPTRHSGLVRTNPVTVPGFIS
jgi:hypothetical protein